VVVGDGPAREPLSRRYPHVRFLGPLVGQNLAAAYAGADVFAFPSRTDTFGLVMVEALASGTPVAAFPVPGPLDVVGADAQDRRLGALAPDLSAAIRSALEGDPAACTAWGQGFDWAHACDQFESGLALSPRESAARSRRSA